MDSVTQFALGGAVGYAALGHRAGRKAAVWGGICGTLPDLDVLVPPGGLHAPRTSPFVDARCERVAIHLRGRARWVRRPDAPRLPAL